MRLLAALDEPVVRHGHHGRHERHEGHHGEEAALGALVEARLADAVGHVGEDVLELGPRGGALVEGDVAVAERRRTSSASRC